MFRAFRIPCTRNCGPQEIIRLALSSKTYGISLSLTAEGILSVGEAAQTHTAFHEAGLTLTSLCADRCLTEDDAALVTLAAEIGARALSLRLRERLPDAQSTLALRPLCTCASARAGLMTVPQSWTLTISTSFALHMGISTSTSTTEQPKE